MMRFFMLFTTICILFTLNSAIPERYQGFIGLYHPYNGTVWPAEGIPDNTTLYDAFHFGIAAIYSKPSAGRWIFEDNIKFHCFNASINAIYGMIAPPSEGGIVNNPNDTNVWKPASSPGLIQSAKRFSVLSTICPQIAGITIDDFYANYENGTITLEQLQDIKAALQGKNIDPETGKVDHYSKAKTPHLRLFICFYAKQISGFKHKELLDVIDGTNLWLFDQDNMYPSLPQYVSQLEAIMPNKSMITGVYIKNSKYGYLNTEGVQGIIGDSISLYNKGKINGMFIFAGVWLSKDTLSIEKWKDYDLIGRLDREYYPHLGVGKGSIFDINTREPLSGVSVNISYIEPFVFVTKKVTDKSGNFEWSGWCEGYSYMEYEKDGYTSKKDFITLEEQKEMSFLVYLTPTSTLDRP